MRIGINFHSSDKYMSGVEYYSLGMINALLESDDQNKYIVFTNQPSLVKESVHSRSNLIIRSVDHLTTRTRRIMWEHFKLPQLARQEKLDVLHCPAYICPLLDLGVSYVITIHDTIAVNYPRWCKVSNRFYFNFFMKAAVTKASAIVAVSKNTADCLRQWNPACASKIRVVHPGIDAVFNTKTVSWKLSEVRCRYKLPDRYILFVGNIEPKKNLPVLLKAYQILRAQVDKLPHKLVLVGKRCWKSKSVLDEISKEASLNNIILIGYVRRDDLPFVYRMADVFVFVSLHEGFGFPPLEAMACGTPVVASARGALKETLGNAAYTVDPSNPQQIAEAVSVMIRNPQLRQEHIRLGKDRSTMFAWSEVASRLLSIYSQVVSNRGQV